MRSSAMSLKDIWRGRERYGEDRDRGRSMSDEWRTGEDWRDEGRYGRERGGVFGSSEREFSGAGQRYGGRSWSPETDYSAGRDYAQQYRGFDEQRDEGRRYGSDPYGRDYDLGESGRVYGGRYGGAQGSERGGRYEYGSASGYGGASGGYGMGQFRGRGPRGYQRSDDRIREDVCERLSDDPQIDASNMEVTVKTGEVTLSGTVSSREDK